MIRDKVDAFEAARAKAMAQYDWVRPKNKDGRNGIRAWKPPPCVFRGEVTFAMLHGCRGGQHVEEEYTCAKTGVDVLAMSCLRCALREESVLASPKAKIVETKANGNGEGPQITRIDTDQKRGTAGYGASAVAVPTPQKVTKSGNGEGPQITRIDTDQKGVTAGSGASGVAVSKPQKVTKSGNGEGPQITQINTDQKKASSAVAVDPRSSRARPCHAPSVLSVASLPLPSAVAADPRSSRARPCHAPSVLSVASLPSPSAFAADPRSSVLSVASLPSPFVVSAVLPARDEGADVAATAASFLSAGVDEVIVVDDASRDGSCAPEAFAQATADGIGPQITQINTDQRNDALGQETADGRRPQITQINTDQKNGPSGGSVDPRSSVLSVAAPPSPSAVRVIRNPTPLGCALCRNIGGRAATGHVIIFADAHMRAESSLRDFALSAYQRNVILNAAVKPLEGEHNTTVYGARIVQDKDSPAYRMAHIVRRPNRASRFASIPGLHGACYAIPRPLWDCLDGWVENQGWGYNEQALSMKAFFLGIPIESDAETIVRHRYRKQFPYSTSLRLTLLNRFITHRTLFSDRTWRRHWLPLFTKSWPDIAAEWATMDRSRRLWKLRDNFRKRKVRTDEEFLERGVSR